MEHASSEDRSRTPRGIDLLEVWCAACGAAVGEDCGADEPHLVRVEAADHGSPWGAVVVTADLEAGAAAA